MANTNAVAVIKTADLLEFLGPELVVMKSDKAKRYPLYISTKIGPWHWNTPGGQDLILEKGRFKGAGSPEILPASITVINPEPNPENPEKIQAPGPEPKTPEPKQTRGFLGGLFTLDD